jgi:hypothetical protein
MRVLIALPLIALLVGCASAPISYRPDPEKPPVLALDPNLKGRGCISVVATPDRLEVILAQDGTSDWSLSRMFAWIGELGAAVFGGAPPSEAGMQGPDPTQGCAQLFETATDEIKVRVVE